MRGILGSPWADNYGFAHFISFFESYYFGRLLRNTLTISLATLVFGFPAPIILALLLNEVRSTRFKRFVQTITYMPHFISMVVICSMIRMFVAENGVITQMLLPFGIKQGSMLSHPEYFVPLYVISGIWQEIGWAPSFTWPRSRASTRNCTKPRASMARAAGSRRCTSPCRAFLPPSSFCSSCAWAA